MMTVTKIFKFEAAHFLPNYEGVCKNVHGHSYKLEVSIGGNVKEDGATNKGMIIDFGDLKKMVNMDIINCLDHCLLNDQFENPTAENLTRWIVDRLKSLIEEIYGFNYLWLSRVRLWETDTSYAEWREYHESL